MNPITTLRRYRWIVTGRWKIKRQIKTAADKRKIIIGSGGIKYDGWIATDLPHFNILKKDDWEYFLGNYKIDNLLAEHVLEHLTEKDVETVFQFAYLYIKKGGCFRITVPDEYNKDSLYRECVRPDGTGPGASDHKSFWNYKSLSVIAKKNNFHIELLEYFDENDNFVHKIFSDERGIISRSKQKEFIFPPVPNYTSLIMDLLK